MKVIQINGKETIFEGCPFKCVRGKKERRPKLSSKSWLHSTLDIYLSVHSPHPEYSLLFESHNDCTKLINALYYDKAKVITIKPEGGIVNEVSTDSNY